MDRGMKKLNNKGVSLVEILVALAVGSIVLAALVVLVVQGVNGYRTQTVSASLQSEANITLNQISDNVMEGKHVTISNNSQGATEYFSVKDDVYYVYDSDDNIIYKTKQPGTSDRSVLCENVTDFRVKIVKSSVTADETQFIRAIQNPVQLQVFIKVEKMNESRQVDRTISIRNSVDTILVMLGGKSQSILNCSLENVSGYIADSR